MSAPVLLNLLNKVMKRQNARHAKQVITFLKPVV